MITSPHCMRSSVSRHLMRAWESGAVRLAVALVFRSPRYFNPALSRVSDLTWQVVGTLDYHPWSWLVLRAGYRHLGVDYDHRGFVFDADISGPIIGASFRF